jgi:hypothetical protein
MAGSTTDPRIPLVRTEGKQFEEGYPTLHSSDLVAEPVLRTESRSDRTRAAEAALGFAPSLYFYVGFAHPDFGDAVLVYEPESFDANPGGATPFDTGGLYHQYIRADGVTTPDERRTYVARHEVGLDQWRAQFAAYLAAHFSTPAAYVRGDRPIVDDASRRLSTAADRRAWTWEVRLYRDHPAFDQLRAAYLSFDYFEEIRASLQTATASQRSLWLHRLATGILRPMGLAESPHHVAIDEIANGCP